MVTKDNSRFNAMQNSKTKPSNPGPHLGANEALKSGKWLEVGAKGQAAVTRSMDACPSPLTELITSRLDWSFTAPAKKTLLHLNRQICYNYRSNTHRLLPSNKYWSISHHPK
ncbi:hypothetical protein MJO28_004317 [Puccinia striiformis f. sp. tritici]|uniref:Uncharacterized protein n=1 Tax=Puccinia striiformis f. sp. tritici TaxID=168172 RepID=A0ACC0ES46_9BASI|nr:hypothetical protein MJO28_004317 [Puccinia striiformis f. sp. tritici]